MNREHVQGKLREFIVRELLDGDDADFTPQTPLLEIGVIDSISTTMLVSFIQGEFGKTVPPGELVPANLASLDAITDLVVRLG